MAHDTRLDAGRLERDSIFQQPPAYTPRLVPDSLVYPGSAISQDRRQTRLLYLEGLSTTTPSHDDHIYGSLVVTDLDQAPSYVALSYVWGEEIQQNSKAIRIRQYGTSSLPTAANSYGQVSISENGYQALWHIRKTKGPVCIWIDAVCINQLDKLERNHQVRYMGDIYSTAQCVWVWLGLGDEGTDRAMQYLRAVGNSSERMPIVLEHGKDGPKWSAYTPVFDSELCIARVKYLPWTFAARFFQETSFKGPGRYLRKLFPNWVVQSDSLRRILAATWLSRSWTLPEFILARDSVLICGDESISWQEFLGCLWRGSLRHHDLQTAHWQALAQAWLSLPRYETALDGTRHKYTVREKLCPSKATVFLSDKKVLYFFVLPLMAAGIYLGAMHKNNNYYKAPSDSKVIWWLKVILPPFGIACATFLVVWFIIKLLYGANRGSPLPLKSYGDDELFNMISTAILNRDCKQKQDKCFSLYSILERHGIDMPYPDYTIDAQQVYIKFFARLVELNPQALALLVDATDTPASSWGSTTTLARTESDASTSLLSPPILRPSWAPDLRRPQRAAWLPREFVLGAAAAIGTSTTEFQSLRTPISPQVFIDVGVLRMPAIPLGIISFRTDLTSLYELHCHTAKDAARLALAEIMLLLEHTQDMYKTRPRLRRRKEANVRSSHFLFFRSVMIPDVWLQWNHQHHYSTAAPREHTQSSGGEKGYYGVSRSDTMASSTTMGGRSRRRGSSSGSRKGGLRAKSERRLWESKSTFNQLAMRYKHFFIPLLRIIRKHRKYREKDRREEEIQRAKNLEQQIQGNSGSAPVAPPPRSSIGAGRAGLPERSLDRLWKVLEGKEKLRKALSEWCLDVAKKQKRAFFATASGFPGTGGIEICVGDELFYVPNAPALMVLRKRQFGLGYHVVGPASGPFQARGVHEGVGIQAVDIY